MLGERVSIEGVSGLGKTRLLRALCKLDPLFHGKLSMNGINFDESNNNHYIEKSLIPSFRSRCIYVPQVSL